jgi:mannose/cellobiose epimerase-like protein (N-acyl-D-glucosamine 2-epimerase family)
MAMENFSINNQNAHKMMLAAVLLAAKFQDDFYYDNKAFEFAGGVNALHLHQLEI